MMRALYSSVAGLKTHQTKMDVIGNNIANVNTVGFKSSRATFSTMMYQTTSFASGANVEASTGGVNAKQIGLGVTFASTAVDIDTGGASESTGKAFDLKLSDKNSTSFYIVNTGTENVFTRAGAFYVDGAGNLCMESTGYTVMGWQVDANGNIQKDTVTPLRIMSTDNQTSAPEYTTKGTCSGILDDNNANANSDTGYNMNLKIYDNLGYPYTARFAVQKTGDKGEYTINLKDILDQNGKSIISGTTARLGDLFGNQTVMQGSNVDITDSYTIASGMANKLKQLEMPDGATLTYVYSAETVNASLKTRLPEGYTVEYTVVPTPAGSTTNTSSSSVIIRDENGDQVDTTTTPFNILSTLGGTGGTALSNLVSSDNPASGTTISMVKDINTMVGEWDDKGTLGPIPEIPAGTTMPADRIVGTLTSDLLAQLEGEFTGFGYTAPTLATGEQIVVTYNTTTGYGYQLYKPASGTTAASFEALTPPLSGFKTYTLQDYIGQSYVTTVDAQAINDAGIFTTDLPLDVELRYHVGDGSYTIVTPDRAGFKMQFSTADGSLTYIGQQGSTSQTLRLSMYPIEDNPFSDIEIDFSTLKNLANGKANTAAMSGGNEGAGEGKKVGTLIGLSVDTSGKIYGNYSNGNTELLGQIAVARFANASGLESIGDNCYRTTMNSGEFDGIGVEMDSDGSSIDSGVLEMSNVDLATEFTYMITTQRGYQANSRVISTSDSILEELVNLKR